MTAVMIDLETMGKTPRAPITSIGAVLFDPHGDEIGAGFLMHVSLENCLRHGLTADASTILWWMEQSEAARLHLTCGQRDAAPLITALDALAAFIPPGAEVWCNGASFDFAILSNAYDVIGQPVPWQFWCECDMRLMKRLYQEIRIEREGVHHTALDDAIHQARLVQHLMCEHDRRAAA